MSGIHEFDDRLSSLKSRWNRLACWSHDVAEQGHGIAVESDRWFVAALQGLDRGMTRARSGVAEAGHQMIVRSKRWLPRVGEDVTPRERIRRAIAREAKRQGFEREQLEQFAGNIGLIVELVLSGVVNIEDIAFEHADDEPAPQSADADEPAPQSADANEPTPDGADRDAGERKPGGVSGTPPGNARSQPAR